MIRVEVIGTPRPGGSKTPGITKYGRLFVRPANPNTATWMAIVEDAALAQYHGALLDGPIEVFYSFRFSRPKRHFKGQSGILKADAPTWHVVKPDLTKIIRSTEDALTNIIWKDDCMVAKRADSKRYCEPGEKPGVSITIFEITNGIYFD